MAEAVDHVCAEDSRGSRIDLRCQRPRGELAEPVMDVLRDSRCVLMVLGHSGPPGCAARGISWEMETRAAHAGKVLTRTTAPHQRESAAGLRVASGWVRSWWCGSPSEQAALRSEPAAGAGSRSG